jgi:PAS domain S-box-containing protein
MSDDSGKLPSIRSQIALLVLACALPSVIGLGVLAQHFYQREQLQITRDTLETARALAAAIEHDLGEAESTALALASSPSIERGDFAAFAAQARRQLRPEFPGTQFVLSDASGRQLANTAGPLQPRMSQPDRLQPVFERGATMLSNLYIGEQADQPLLAVDVPVQRDGKTAYVLSVLMRPEQMAGILAEQKLPPHMMASLLDANGVILARSRDAQKFVGKTAPAPLLAQLRQKAEGVVQTGSMEGVPVYAGFGRVPGHNWTIAVGMPEAHALDGMLPSVPLITSAAAALVLAGIAMAWLLGGHISRSIRALTAPARALAGGTPMQLAPMSFREAQDVATALCQVERDISRHRHDLESLVAERTAQLEASKALLENVYASAPVGLSFVDLDLRIVMINEYLARINGKPVSEHIGHLFGDVIRDKQVELEVERDYRKVLATGEAISGIEMTGTFPDHPDEVRHMLSSYFPVRAADGSLIGITGLLLDITAQKCTESALRESKQLFTSVVEHMPATLFVKRASDLRYEMLNHEGELTIGLPRERVLGKSDHDLFPAEQADAYAAADRAVLSSGEVLEVGEEAVTTASGDTRYLNTRKVALRGEDGQPTYLLGMSIDITERKRADEVLQATSLSLARSNAFIRTVTDQLPGMVIYWDAELRCRFANRYFSEFMGMDVSEIIGATMQQVMGEELYRRNRARVEGVLAGCPQSFFQDHPTTARRAASSSWSRT